MSIRKLNEHPVAYVAAGALASGVPFGSPAAADTSRTDLADGASRPLRWTYVDSSTGRSLATGDINGDGLADSIIGTNTFPGSTFVVYGRDTDQRGPGRSRQ